MAYEWDPAKAAANRRKHGARFADTALALEAPEARTVPDPDAAGEERFVTLAADPAGRVLVKASRSERRLCEAKPP
jgi:uncharacterized DUF497 family protein